jgi:hypothetical protein
VLDKNLRSVAKLETGDSDAEKFDTTTKNKPSLDFCVKMHLSVRTNMFGAIACAFGFVIYVPIKLFPGKDVNTPIVTDRC